MGESASLIDRSLVAILDIEGWSREAPKGQADLVAGFIKRLDGFLKSIEDLGPDAYSTGDGAIVSVGRRHVLDPDSTRRFLVGLVEFTGRLLGEGLIVRVAVNTGQRDLVVPIPAGSALRGEIIQVGDTINIAARILTFCEPREIMLSDATVSWLRLCDLQRLLPLRRNDPLITKHEVSLQTYSYDPPRVEGTSAFYSPSSATHEYKRFAGFPSIKPDTLASFMPSGLHKELSRVVTNAYDSMRAVNDTRTFLSWRNVLKVLVQLNYDPTDEILVLSRNERPSGFWTQERREEYLAYLQANAARNGGYINQTRVMVHRPVPAIPTTDDLMPASSLHEQMLALHKTESYYSVPSTILLANYDRLSALSFGFTLSTKHRFVVIPVPSPEEIEGDAIEPKNLRHLLRAHAEYRASDGPFKAVVSADEQLVSELEREMRQLIAQHAIKLK